MHGTTTFASHSMADTDDPNHAFPMGSPQGNPDPGYVLLVDDEPGMLKLLRVLVSELGLAPIEARDAASAEMRIQSCADIRLLVSDISLPGTSGIDLAKRFLARYPDRPVLLISGYPDTDIPSSVFQGFPKVRFRQKPFGIRELDSLMRALLDG